MKHSISMVGSLFVLFTAIAFSQIREKLSLHDAINIAVQNNPEILASRHEIDAAAGRVLQAGRFPNPEFSISFNESPANFAIGDANEKDFGISQTFEFPGKRSSRIEVAEQEQTFSELTVARKTAIVATQVKQIYYQALLAAAIKENITFNIALLDDLLETVTLRYQSGANTYLEILRVKIEKTRLSNDAVEAERDYRLRIGNLKTILGKSVDADIALSDSLVYEPFRMAEDSALSVLTEQSYYLKMKEQELLIQQSAYNLAEKSYLPDLKFGLALQNRLGTFPDEGSKNYLGLEVGVSLPLWFQQGPKGEVQEALALTRATEYRLTAARQQVQQNIVNAYRVVTVAEQQLKLFETSLLQEAEDALQTGTTAYQNNTLDILNLFDIYRTYRDTKAEHVRALFIYVTSLAELESAKELSGQE